MTWTDSSNHLICYIGAQELLQVHKPKVQCQEASGEVLGRSRDAHCNLWRSPPPLHLTLPPASAPGSLHCCLSCCKEAKTPIHWPSCWGARLCSTGTYGAQPIHVVDAAITGWSTKPGGRTWSEQRHHRWQFAAWARWGCHAEITRPAGRYCAFAGKKAMQLNHLLIWQQSLVTWISSIFFYHFLEPQLSLPWCGYIFQHLVSITLVDARIKPRIKWQWGRGSTIPLSLQITIENWECKMWLLQISLKMLM